VQSDDDDDESTTSEEESESSEESDSDVRAISLTVLMWRVHSLLCMQAPQKKPAAGAGRKVVAGEDDEDVCVVAPLFDYNHRHLHS
jgi:hypothetical protein